MNKTKRTNKRKTNFSKNGGTRRHKRPLVVQTYNSPTSTSSNSGYNTPPRRTIPVNARPVRPRRVPRGPASGTIPFPLFTLNQPDSPTSVTHINDPPFGRRYGGNKKKSRKRKIYGKGLAASRMVMNYMDQNTPPKPTSLHTPPERHFIDRSLSSPPNDIESLGSMNKLNYFNPIKTSFNSDNNSTNSSYDSLAGFPIDEELDKFIEENELNKDIPISNSPLGYVTSPRRVVTQREYSPLPPGKEVRSVSAPTYIRTSPAHDHNNNYNNNNYNNNNNTTYIRTSPAYNKKKPIIKSNSFQEYMDNIGPYAEGRPIKFGGKKRKTKRKKCKQKRNTRKFI